MTRQRDAPRNRRVSPYHELLFLCPGHSFDHYCICTLVRQGQHTQEVCPSIETSITLSDRTARRRAAIKFSPGRRILYVTAQQSSVGVVFKPSFSACSKKSWLVSRRSCCQRQGLNGAVLAAPTRQWCMSVRMYRAWVALLARARKRSGQVAIPINDMFRGGRLFYFQSEAMVRLYALNLPHLSSTDAAMQ